jgi:hypothetical protein
VDLGLFVEDRCRFRGLAFATSVKAPILALVVFDRERVPCSDSMIESRAIGRRVKPSRARLSFGGSSRDKGE